MRLHVKSLALASAVAATLWMSGSAVTAAGSAPGDALAKLKAGNARFVASPEDALPVAGVARTAPARGQTPFATILSCADARLPPEMVFHTGPGDLFVVRAAGNITDKAILASVEYSVESLHVPLVAVMGHESCGVVKAAADTPVGQSLGPNLDYLIAAIRPSLKAAASRPEAERMRAAILANVEETLNDMVSGSQILRKLANEGKVQFVGAYQELAGGLVYFSEPVVLAPPSEAHTKGEHH